MENTNGIYKKLQQFAEKNITVEKDATNPFHKNNYTTLNEVLEKVQKPLAELGLILTQYGEVVEGQAGLMTRIADVETAETVDSFFPFVGATDAQKLGSNITYIRRYAVIALLGLRSEDDDGTAAVGMKGKDVTAKAPF